MHRRDFLKYMAALGLAAGVGRRLVLPEEVWALDSGPGPAISADEALKILQDGNARYLEGKPQYPHQGRERRALTAGQGQHPLAAVLSCSDSRVPVELIFDQGLGDLFVVRVAGNAAATDEIGSLEYAVEHLSTPLVVVMGHSQCGAVNAVLENANFRGSLPALLAPIRPAVARAREENPGVTGDALLAAAIKDNVWEAMKDILQRSNLIKGAVKAGSTKLVGAYYELDTGKVEWLGPDPGLEKLLGGAGRGGAKTRAREEKKPDKQEE